MFRARSQGLTLAEILIALAIISIISALMLGAFASYRGNQGLSKDTEMVVEVLRQARVQTLVSKNASPYGVHFATSSIVLFAGTSYSPGLSSNVTFELMSPRAAISTSLLGGGSDVVFDRLTGETSQSGSVTLSSSAASTTKTIVIYKTGTIDWQ